jgi:hypothetical protein
MWTITSQERWVSTHDLSQLLETQVEERKKTYYSSRTETAWAQITDAKHIENSGVGV